MATLAFGLVGQSISPAMGFLGGMLGSYLDSRFVMPSLFPADDQEGPRLDDLSVQLASEGSPVNYCFGPENRIAGTVIFCSDIIEVEDEEDVGGCGGGETYSTFSYYADLAIGICGNEISSVEQIWADGTKLYDADIDVSYTSTTFSAELITEKWWDNQAEQWFYGYQLKIATTDDTIDMTAFQSGYDVVVSGFTGDTDNNGTWPCLRSESDAVYLRVDSTCGDDAAGESVTLTQDLPEYDESQVSDFTFYTGSSTQDPDTLLITYIDDTPSWRGLAYVVIERLCLNDFGNRIPNFTFQVKQAATKTVASTIGDICELSGLTSDDYDTSSVDAANVRGYNIRGTSSTTQALQPLMLVYDIIAQERDGKIYFLNRANAEDFDVDSDNLAAHTFGSDAPRSITVTDEAGYDLPSEVNVQYFDPELDYQSGSQREVRHDVSTTNVLNVNTSLVMAASDARSLAKRILWTAYANRQHVAMQLPPSQMSVQEGDTISVTANGEDWICLVEKVDRGNDGLLKVDTVNEVASALTFTSTAESPADVINPVYLPGHMALLPIDIAPLRDAEVNKPGIYYGGALYNANSPWKGAYLWVSEDGTNYTADAQFLNGEARIGYTEDTLGGGVEPGYWDEVNDVTVQLYHGTLSSATHDQVLTGRNRMIINREIIGFRNATLESTRQYKLSGLLRGLRATEDFIDEHDTGEPCMLLNALSCHWLERDASLIGQSLYFKAIPRGAPDPGEVEVHELTFNAESMQCFPPCHVYAVRAATNNMFIYWTRRTRAITRLMVDGICPTTEWSEKYKVVIWNATRTEIKRILVVRNRSWAQYLATHQSADGYSPGDPIKIDVHQFSWDLNMYGKGISATV